MEQEKPTIDGPDPAATLAQAAGLAEHLQRIGVQWLPTPDAESTQALATQFRVAGQDTPQPQPEAASRPTSAPATPVTAQPAAAQPAAAQPAAAQPAAAQPAAPATAPSPPGGSPAPGFALQSDSAAANEPYAGPPLAADARAAQLAAFAETVAACTRCEILSKCRTKTVFGEGNVTPRIVFFGEGPGREEDLSGRPFVGKAGQLLTKMIGACKFAREDVYIMNTVKCRPPNNRNPEPTEIENCREYFQAQFQILRPEYIVCLGLVSAQALLQTKLSVGRLRGKFHSYFDSKVLVTYHPSYLLRNPAAKKAAWEDLQLMLRDAGLM
ncbi:Uracil DNA glycosylase superfamily protein [Stieleria maiorica]|uniref:Type-4 uracil-DNA glycosylase n=1 Tax=Stieleria maiorica TaxID=2795974 RepID=A0A5B9MIZ6_9BACT|nr:uracil-DNA glycosylase [Stieleria maiorica]QEF99940.1 Uracil DNA glycosylase superfamily protein [Stieleria maiorica]